MEKLKRKQLDQFYAEKLENNDSVARVIWNTFSFFLTLYSVFLVLLSFIFDFKGELYRAFLFIDYSVCTIFLVEFFFRFFKSDHKKHFFVRHIFDLVGAIPLGEFRFLRLLRAFLLFRTYRATRKAKIVRKKLRDSDSLKTIALDTFVFIFLTTVFLIMVASFSILMVEGGPDSNIKKLEDAFWWSWVTITTVGYGDHYPVTVGGKIIASFLMIFGIALFSAVTISISTIILSFFHLGQDSQDFNHVVKKIDKFENSLQKAMAAMSDEDLDMEIKIEKPTNKNQTKRRRNGPSGKKE